MALLGETTVTVQTWGGSRVDGRWVPAAVGAPRPIVASVQPLKSDAFDPFPEGARAKGAQLMIVEGDPEIKTTDLGAGHEADRVTHKGRVYAVHALDDWTDHRPPGLPHFAFWLELVGRDETRP